MTWTDPRHCRVWRPEVSVLREGSFVATERQLPGYRWQKDDAAVVG